MDLSEKAKNNLSVILSLEKDDTLTANRGTLSKQDEFVQIDNVQELEYAIFQQLNFHIIIKQNANTTPNTMMTKQSKSLQKNTQKTLSILIINLENKK